MPHFRVTVRAVAIVVVIDAKDEIQARDLAAEKLTFREWTYAGADAAQLTYDELPIAKKSATYISEP